MLVVVALVRRPSPLVPRGVRGFFVTAASLTLILGWVGGPLLGIAQHFPVFSNNDVGRIRSVLGFFIAVLAAIGFDALQRRPERRPRWTVSAEFVVWSLAAVAVLFTLHRVQLASRASHLVSSSRYVLPLVVAVFAVLAVAVASSARASGVRIDGVSLRWLALALIPLLVLVESLSFVLPFWARIPRDQFYPRTPAESFLKAHLDGQRMVGVGAMPPGTNAYYGVATPDGHAFTDPRWKDVLQTIDPKVFKTPTHSYFSGPLSITGADSPLFDRLGVRYLVVPLASATYGTLTSVGAGNDEVLVEPGRSVDIPIPPGPLRGVAVHLTRALAPRDRFARIGVDVLDAQGRFVASASRRLYEGAGPGDFVVPLAAETTSAPVPARIRVRLLSRDGTLRLSGTDGVPRLNVIRPADDGLRLDFVDGVGAYRRLNALPLIRWADHVRVIPNAAARLTELANNPAQDGTVVLDHAAPTADGLPAKVHVEHGEGDVLQARVDAQGDGYLVVADALGAGWTARVDGKNAAVLRADHALAAIRVPKGDHVVRIVYHPPHGRLGAIVSLLSLALLLAIAVVAFRRRRTRDASPPDTDGLVLPTDSQPAGSLAPSP